MTGQAIRAAVLNASLAVALIAQTTVGVIRLGPLPTPQDVAALEARVLQSPDDLDAERTLLEIYAVPPGRYDPTRQSLRLQRILYMVQHHPDEAVSGSRAAYVYRANRPDANGADHEAVRQAWLNAVQAHPKNTAVTLNAVRFLEVEDSADAEQVLRRAVDAEQENRELAANLGFFYAMELRGLDTLAAGAPPTITGRDRPNRAMAELQQNSNPVVLAAAATAVFNLAKGYDFIDATAMDFANGLVARARQLAPDDADIQGPMPLIKYFAAAQSTSAAAPAPAPSTSIRIGETVQSANLVRRTQPQYPAEAQAAGITGEVKFSILIARDGTVRNVQLISGHPLLVEAGRQAVEMWVYKPTLLNGAPVEVTTSVTLTFPSADH